MRAYTHTRGQVVRRILRKKKKRKGGEDKKRKESGTQWKEERVDLFKKTGRRERRRKGRRGDGEKSSNKETPAAVNIAFASSSSLSMNAASPALIFARAICTRVSRMPVHFLWRDGSKLPREQEFRYVEWRRLFRFS